MDFFEIKPIPFGFLDPEGSTSRHFPDNKELEDLAQRLERPFKGSQAYGWGCGLGFGVKAMCLGLEITT